MFIYKDIFVWYNLKFNKIIKNKKLKNKSERKKNKKIIFKFL